MASPVIYWESKGPIPPMPRFPQEIGKALLRGYEAHHCPFNNPLIRPYFLGGGGHWGGANISPFRSG